MKTCTGCGDPKPETYFYLQDKMTGRRHAECKDCYSEHRKAYYKSHYLKYGEMYRERAKIRRARIKRELQQKMMRYLADKSCLQCGENDTCVLDFDHINPQEKSFSIARATTNGLEWDKILTEISKCQILCANCHRKRTAMSNGWYKLH